LQEWQDNSGNVLASIGATGSAKLGSFVVPGIAFTQTATVSVANTTTETTLLGSGTGSLTLAGGSLVPGRTLRFRASGFYGSTSSPGNLTVNVKLGSVAVLTATNALVASVSNQWWSLDAEITCRSTGASGSVMGNACVLLRNAAPALAVIGWEMVNTSPVTVDTTGALTVDLTATFTVQSSSNTISCTNASLEVLN
jgi:hypothetical protein